SELLGVLDRTDPVVAQHVAVRPQLVDQPPRVRHLLSPQPYPHHSPALSIAPRTRRQAMHVEGNPYGESPSEYRHRAVGSSPAGLQADLQPRFAGEAVEAVSPLASCPCQIFRIAQQWS